jgi:hypothetical protein
VPAFVGKKPNGVLVRQGSGKSMGKKTDGMYYTSSLTAVYFYTCSTVDSDYRGAGGPPRGWEGVAANLPHNPIREPEVLVPDQIDQRAWRAESHMDRLR